MSDDRLKTFEEFWPFYLKEHRDPVNRRLHFFGTGCVLLLFIYALFIQRLAVLWFCPLLGYGFAWIGHFLIEKNRPATFRYPLWSLLGDFKMFFFAMTGRLNRELKRHLRDTA